MRSEREKRKLRDWLRGFPSRGVPRCAITASTASNPALGFAASEDANVAVCVRPGTELSFAREVMCQPIGMLGWRHKVVVRHKTAIFRQINKEKIAVHHDALEFPDGQITLLTCMREGQEATVLQLPAEPTTAFEVEAQRRVAFVG